MAEIAVPSSSRRAPIFLPIMFQGALQAYCQTIGERRDDAFYSPALNLVRTMIQQVVISPRADGSGVDLEIHGRLAAVLASLEAWVAEEKRLGLEKYARAQGPGLLQESGREDRLRQPLPA